MKVEDTPSLLAEANHLLILNAPHRALPFYNEALELAESEASKANVLVQRASCYIALERYNDAKADIDALSKLQSAPEECTMWRLMREAQLLEAQGETRQALQRYKEALEKDTGNEWLERRVKKLAGGSNAPQKDAQKQTTTATKPAPPAQQAKPSSTSAPTSSTPPQQQQRTILPPSQQILTARDRIKYNHYFMNGKCFLSVLGLRNVPNDKRRVQFLDDETVRVEVQLPDGTEWNKDFVLYGKINPEQCSFQNYAPKIEIQLDLANKLEDWPRLQRDENTGSSYDINKIKQYPSSKSHTDWDKIEAEIREEEKKKKEGEGNINALFQQIYANADEDTRKAMLKSYTESGGTVLSTNWNEVGSKTVTPSPPSSMEAKKYGD